jgi:hypothetical protein
MNEFNAKYCIQLNPLWRTHERIMRYAHYFNWCNENIGIAKLDTWYVSGFDNKLNFAHLEDYTAFMYVFGQYT